MRIRSFIIAATFSTMALSCSKDNITVDAGCTSGNIDFVSRRLPLAEDTRVDFNPDGSGCTVVWTDDDAVGIFAMTDDMTDVSGQRNAGYGAIPLSDATQCSFEVMEGISPLKWKLNSRHLFYAYYPYSSVNDGAEPSAVTVALASEQQQAQADDMGHLGASAIMVAAPVEREPGDDSPVNLEFTNMLSVVGLRLGLESGIEPCAVEKITLSSASSYLAFASGEVDLTSANPEIRVAGGVDKVTLSLNGEAVLDSQGEKNFYFTVLPSSHDAGSLRLDIELASGGYISHVIESAAVFAPNTINMRSIIFAAGEVVPYRDAETVTVESGSSEQYEIGSLATDNLYTDRDYVIENLPRSFAQWQVARCGIKGRLGGTITADDTGLVYVVARTTHSSLMEAEGWSAVSPVNNDNGNAVTDSSGAVMVIWSKVAEKGVPVDIPKPTDSYFGTILPIAPHILQPEVPIVRNITVESGTDVPYRLTDLAGKPLFNETRSDYMANLPAEYSSWKIASTNISFQRLGGTITAGEEGMIFMLTHTKFKEVMTAAGWKAVTPADKADAGILLLGNGHFMTIWSRKVSAGEVVPIPDTNVSGDDNTPDNWGVYCPIAPSITIVQ